MLYLIIARIVNRARTRVARVKSKWLLLSFKAIDWRRREESRMLSGTRIDGRRSGREKKATNGQRYRSCGR